MVNKGRHPAHGREGDKPANLKLLPATRAAMERLGWDRPDIVLVTGDAYVDHPSFPASLLGRLLEAEGYKVAILARQKGTRWRFWRGPT